METLFRFATKIREKILRGAPTQPALNSVGKFLTLTVVLVSVYVGRVYTHSRGQACAKLK